jgi:hypothetical protein
MVKFFAPVMNRRMPRRKGPSSAFARETKKNHNTPVRIAGYCAQFQILDFINTKQD